MKVCVFGAGAIGGHLASRLARGGAAVSVVARGAQLDAIRARGLTVRAPDGEHRSRPRATEDPRDLGPQDAVVVAVKGPALPSVAAGIGPLLRDDNTPVAFAMNGVPWWYFDRHGGPLEGHPLPALDPGGALRAAVGVARTLGGVVYSACEVVEPGVVHVEHANNRLLLGEPDGTHPSPRAEALAALLRAGGMAAPVVPDIRREVWAKLLANLANGPICVLTGAGAADTYADPALRAAAERVVAEGAAVARALGQLVEVDPAARVAGMAALRHKPSILQDFERGRPMEVEALWRAPLALARLAGVETPTLDLTVALATRRAREAGLYAPPPAA